MSKVLMALAWLFAAQTVPAGQEPPIATVDDVIVTGSVEDEVRRYVELLTQPGPQGRFAGQIARWERPVCVGVVGMPPERSHALATEVTGVIQSLDRPTADDGCATNALIIVTDRADTFAKEFADRNRTQIFNGRAQAVSAFIGPSRAVRWQHRRRLAGVGSSGEVDTLAGAMGAFGGRLPDSRLKKSSAAQIDSSVLIVDRDRVGLATTEALAAYFALAILVELPSKPEAAQPDSILGLFNEDVDQTLPLGLSAWDRAFVEAVYASRRDQGFQTQQSDIAATMRAHLRDRNP